MREFAQRTLTDPEPRTKFGEDDKPDDDIDDFQPRRAFYEGGSDDEENDQDVKAQQGVAEAMRLTAAAEIEAPHLFADRRRPSFGWLGCQLFGRLVFGRVSAGH